MNPTRPLILSRDQLSRIANLPIDAEIKSGGVTGGSEFDGIFARISSKEFKAEDCDKPIEIKGNG